MVDLAAETKRSRSTASSISGSSVNGATVRPYGARPKGMEDVESVTTMTMSQQGLDSDSSALPDPTIVYQNYKFDHTYSDKLAITAHQEEVKKLIFPYQGRARH